MNADIQEIREIKVFMLAAGKSKIEQNDGGLYREKKKDNLKFQTGEV